MLTRACRSIFTTACVSIATRPDGARCSVSSAYLSIGSLSQIGSSNPVVWRITPLLEKSSWNNSTLPPSLPSSLPILPFIIGILLFKRPSCVDGAGAGAESRRPPESGGLYRHGCGGGRGGGPAEIQPPRRGRGCRGGKQRAGHAWVAQEEGGEGAETELVDLVVSVALLISRPR